jgi:hypothetical protein
VKKRILITFLGLLNEAQSPAQEVRVAQHSSFQGPRIEFSAPNLIFASIFSSINFGWGDHFSMGPIIGLHPAYLFLTKNNPIFSYDLGIDSNIFVFGDRYSSSYFINPYSYYSGFASYRVEEPSIRVGFNVGYRWLSLKGYSLALGIGIQSISTSLSVYSYSPNHRVHMGSVQTFVPIAPGFKIAIGLPI